MSCIIPPPLECGKKVFDFSKQSYIMGIVNITPDSFSDGGCFLDPEKALSHALELEQQGADIIDIGGESSRPGASPVSAETEISRVVPVIEKLCCRLSVPVSIDTTKAGVAAKALEAGAEMVNDISALRFDNSMADTVRRFNAALVLMHMRHTPQTMQQNICYDNLIPDIYDFLSQSVDHAADAGIDRNKIIVDPGIGFGKSVDRDNFTILKELSVFTGLGRPVLVGPSRKAFIGKLLGKQTGDRDNGTAAAAAVAIYNGANIIRVHDVKKMKEVIRVVDAIKQA